MPELPDLEVFKQYLDASTLHKRTELVRCRSDAPLHDVSETTFRQQLDGTQLMKTSRH